MSGKLKIIFALLSLSTGALAQSAAEAWQPAKGSEVTSSSGQPSGFQRSGGSLLRATLGTQPDPGKSPLKNVGVFAVDEPEPKTLKKHDLVTIIIREESTSSSKGNSDLKKDQNLNMALQQWIALDPASFSVRGGAAGTTPPVIQWTNHRDLKGQATIDRADSTIARIEAEVVDVKPNGTLVLSARKRIKNDEEEKEILVSGICMASDVGPDNSILSSQLHDLDLTIKTSGAVRDTTKRGWLPKLVDVINPF